MTTTTKYILNVAAFIVFILALWFFSNVVVYLLFAFVFALVLSPLVDRLHQIRITRFRLSTAFSTMIALILFISVLFALGWFILPSLLGEMRLLSTIDYEILARNLSVWLTGAQDFLIAHHFIDEKETIIGNIVEQVRQMLSVTAVTDILGGAVNFVGSFFLSIFSVFFLTFFFIKDKIAFRKNFLRMFPQEQKNRVDLLLTKISNLLSRYFSGLLLEIVVMIFLLSIGMLICGVKGAILFGVMGGILNMIPYLGPILGCSIATILAMIHAVSVGDYSMVLPTGAMIIAIFVCANLVDNIILQPAIYSKSVKVHPVEIFLVIIMSGMLFGFLGVFFAIPVYTIIRTIAISIFRKEYLHEIN